MACDVPGNAKLAWRCAASLGDLSRRTVVAVYLDEPYPDEMLFSVVARYVKDHRVENRNRFLRLLFGDGYKRISESNRLDYLADEIYPAWGMSASEIVARMTLSPFFASIFPGDDRLKRVAERQRCVPWTGYLGPGKPGIRYCQACWREDDRDGNPRYWRRSHQLPGVVVCARHRRVLFSFGATFARTLLDAAQRQGGGCAVVSGSSIEVEAWWRVAVLAGRLLHGEAQWSNFSRQSGRIGEAQRCGYVVNHKVDGARMAEDLTRRLGGGYFSAVALQRSLSGELQRAVVLADNRVCAPLFTLLVGYLLADVDARSITSDLPDCPGSRSNSDSTHRVIRWGHHDGPPHYLCFCGFSFVVDCGARAAGVIPTQEGADLARAAAMLLERRYSMRTVEKMLGVSGTAIRQMVGQRVEVRGWTRRTERAKTLVQWVELVAEYGGPEAAYRSNAHVVRSLGKLVEVLPNTVIPEDAMRFDRKRRVHGER